MPMVRVNTCLKWHRQECYQLPQHSALSSLCYVYARLPSDLLLTPVDSIAPKILLHTKKLIEFLQPLTPAWSVGLDLPIARPTKTSAMRLTLVLSEL